MTLDDHEKVCAYKKEWEDAKERIEELKSAIKQLTEDVIGFTMLEADTEGDAHLAISNMDCCDCEILCHVLGLYSYSLSY